MIADTGGVVDTENVQFSYNFCTIAGNKKEAAHFGRLLFVFGDCVKVVRKLYFYLIVNAARIGYHKGKIAGRGWLK